MAKNTASAAAGPVSAPALAPALAPPAAAHVKAAAVGAAEAEGDAGGEDDASGNGDCNSAARGLAATVPAAGPLTPLPRLEEWQQQLQQAVMGAPASHFSAHQLNRACESLLKRLQRTPDDPMLDWHFAMSTHHLKYIPPHRWAKWPFDERKQQQQTARRASEPPGPLGAPYCVRRSATELVVEWPEYAIREDVPNDMCDGYTLEMAPLCPLDGMAAWQRGYHGMRRGCTLRGLTHERDVLVRARAFNSKGGGPWSAVVRLRVEVPRRPPPTELTTIPDTWWLIEIEDLLKQERLEEGTDALTDAMESLFGALHVHRSAIKVAYRYYSLIGATGSGDAAGLMNSTQFLNFVKGCCDLLDDKGPIKWITSDVDLVYKRSIREPSPSTAAPNAPPPVGYLVQTVPGAPSRMAAAAGAAAGAPGTDGSASGSGGGGGGGNGEWRKTRAAVKVTNIFAAKRSVGNLMAQHQFVGGLMRLASARYPRLPGLGARLRALCDERLVDHVTRELDLVSDTFSQLMVMQPMAAVLRKHRLDVERIFGYYAGVDKSLGAETATMNARELQILCEDAKIFKSGGLSLREMVNAFARVNIEDDLFEQEDKLNTSTELVFDEFWEALARMYRARDWSKADYAREEGLEFARGFHGWLGNTLVPTLITAIKTRRKENK